MTQRTLATLLAALFVLIAPRTGLGQPLDPVVPAEPVPTGEAEPGATIATEPAVVAPPPSPGADVGPDHPDLVNGGFGVVVGDAKETPQTSARIGFVGDTLHVMAARYEGAIFNPEVDLHLVLEPGMIQRVGLKRYGFNRQIHADLGDRTVVFSLSGRMLVDAKGTTALYERLVASGIPSFKPKRFVNYPYKPTITIYY